MQTYVLARNEPWISCTKPNGDVYHGVRAVRISDGHPALYRSVVDIVSVEPMDTCLDCDERRSECAQSTLQCLYVHDLFRTEHQFDLLFRTSMMLLARNPALRVESAVSRAMTAVKEFEMKWGRRVVFEEQIVIPWNP